MLDCKGKIYKSTKCVIIVHKDFFVKNMTKAKRCYYDNFLYEKYSIEVQYGTVCD